MLKAKTRIKAHVNGEVVEFAIGQEVKGLSEGQVTELKASGALEDTVELAKAEKVAAQAQDKALDAFMAEREAIQAGQADLAPSEAPASGKGASQGGKKA